MKRLLVVNVFFNPRSFGGATVVAEQVANRLQQKDDWRVSVVSYSRYGMETEPAVVRTNLPNGADHYTINVGGHRTQDEAFENPLITHAFAALLDRIAPDVAHVHCVPELGVGVVAALKERGTPILLSTHDYWWFCERTFMIDHTGRHCGQQRIDASVCGRCVQNASTLPARHARAHEILRMADVITYPSDEARRRHELNGVSGEPGVVVANGVAAPKPGYAEARRARSRRGGPLRFGFVGGPGPVKGWPMIQEAFGDFSAEEAEIVVPDAARHIDVTWWNETNIGPIAKIVRPVEPYTMETADEFYAGVDVLLFLSQWPETFGLTSHEAAIRGVHVLATDCGAPVAHLTDGDTATILKGYGDVASLRTAARRLIEEGAPTPTAAGLAKAEAGARSFDKQASEVDAILRRLAR